VIRTPFVAAELSSQGYQQPLWISFQATSLPTIEGTAIELDADINFAHPYSSCEHGVNENTNELLDNP
jgi:hypothetical protein